MTQKEKKYKEITILLVEDDDVDAMGIERSFKKLKLLNSIVRARDGEEALAMLRTPDSVPRPYIILLDLNMPRMNGLEMLEELRNDSNLSSSIVFVLTTSNSDEDKMAAYHQHIAGYIVKNAVHDDFWRVTEMLDHYWRVVEFPIISL